MNSAYKTTLKVMITEYSLLSLVLIAFFSISIALEFNLYSYLSVLLPLFWYKSRQPKTLTLLILFILVIIIGINMSYLLFVDYMNKPWFSGDDPFTCDGPCYGWYTFEQDIGSVIILNLLLVITFSTLSTLLHHFLKRRRTNP